MNDKVIKEIDKNWVQGHFDFDQRDYFIELLTQHKPKYCLETGFCSGTSSVTICASSKPEKMISIGLAQNNMEVANELKDTYNFRLIEGDSTKVLIDKFFETEYENGIDFYHVDGGHTYEVAKHDLVSAYNYMNDNSIIIVDDYHSNVCNLPEVAKAVDEFAKENNLEVEQIRTNSGKGMAKIVINKL
jgi:predicted O-methyltransferase YrrM